MEKSMKYYKKSIQYYNEGDINKALLLAEKCISINLKNAAAINLKGLLVYLQGNIEEAQSLWKLNKDYNNDEVSKKYLQNIKEDIQRLEMYNEACKLIKNFHIKDAIDLLKRCEESDFNTINVSNALATCLIHVGRYEEALAYIKKTLDIDKKNKVAIDNKKLLIEYNVVAKEGKLTHYSIKAISTISIITILVAMVFGVRNYLSLVKAPKDSKIDVYSSSKNEQAVGDKESVKAEANKEDVNKTDSKDSTISKNEKKFPYDELKSQIESLDYSKIYEIIETVAQYNRDPKEDALYKQAINVLKDKGVSFFYIEGRNLHKNKNFDNALNNYKKAEKYAEGSYLHPDIIFMMADSYKSLGNVEVAIQYYEKYLSGNFNSGYKETVLYELALIYKDRDKDKAKKYASIIDDKYPDSDYNNTIIKSILDAP